MANESIDMNGADRGVGKTRAYRGTNEFVIVNVCSGANQYDIDARPIDGLTFPFPCLDSLLTQIKYGFLSRVLRVKGI